MTWYIIRKENACASVREWGCVSACRCDGWRVDIYAHRIPHGDKRFGSIEEKGDGKAVYG